MADKALSAALEWGRRLFREVLDCTLHIQKELAGAELPGEIRGRIEEICDALARLEHEASAELSALEHDLSDSEDSRISALYCFHHLADRLDRELKPFHALMSKLIDAAGEGGDYGWAHLPFVTVAGDIQVALSRFRAAVAIVEALEDNAVAGPGGDEPIAGRAGALRKAPPRLVPRNLYDWVSFAFTCTGCGWSGCGSQTTLGRRFSPGAAYGCPRCRRMIGVVPFPP